MVVTAGETEITAPAEPLLHEYVLPPEAVSVADAPVQMIPSLLPAPEVSVTETDPEGLLFTTSVVVCDGRQAGSEGKGVSIAYM